MQIKRLCDFPLADNVTLTTHFNHALYEYGFNISHKKTGQKRGHCQPTQHQNLIMILKLSMTKPGINLGLHFNTRDKLEKMKLNYATKILVKEI